MAEGGHTDTWTLSEPRAEGAHGGALRERAVARRELRMFMRRLGILLVALGAVVVAGSVGFALIEGVSPAYGFEWTIDTITTLGTIPDPGDTGGRALKVGLELLGVGTLFYGLATVAEFFVSGQLSGVLEERRIEKMIESYSDHYIVCGFGRVGRQVARDLRAAGVALVVIDPNPANREAARSAGIPLIESQPSEDEVLNRAGIERAAAVIACVDSDAENIFIALTARELRSDIFIIARASAEDSEKKLLRAGADRVISPYKTSGSEMARVALRPQVGGALDVANYRVEEIEVSPECEGGGRTVSDVSGPVRIVALRHRSGELETQPPPQTVLESGDMLVAMGAPDAVERLDRMFQPPRTHIDPWHDPRTVKNGQLHAPLQELAAAVEGAAASVRGEAGEPAAQPTLDRPRHRGHGDYSTNAAMLLAPVLSAPPREIAERIRAQLSESLGEELERAEVAGPGFLNLVLSDTWHRRALHAVLAAGERFGAGGASRGERILLEFVSANPTGPLVAASGRHAAYGDALGRILEHHGHRVSREYYFNDAGNQIRLLGESVRARARGEEVPRDGYQGSYVADLAEQIPDAAEAPVDQVAARAVKLLLAQIKGTLERYGVWFDNYFSERTLHEGSPSALQRALSLLEEGGLVYRAEGALWLRTTAFGDDKDRVVVRSNGDPTYLAGDIAYIQNKRERGFERQLIPLGADHTTYAMELKAAMAAVGGDPDAVESPIIQFVHLVAGDEAFAMSKRRGDFITLDDLVDEIGVDATRFFMLQRSQDRTIDLDVELARKQSRENPVYYVQYAHARIASMLRRLPRERVAGAVAPDADWGAGALEAPERDLIKKLVAFPGEVAEAAVRRAPHRIAGYALELAQEFTAFYEACRVLGAAPEQVESQRIALSVAAQTTIALSLGLLGVSAPESM